MGTTLKRVLPCWVLPPIGGMMPYLWLPPICGVDKRAHTPGMASVAYLLPSLTHSLGVQTLKVAVAVLLVMDPRHFSPTTTTTTSTAKSRPGGHWELPAAAATGGCWDECYRCRVDSIWRWGAPNPMLLWILMLLPLLMLYWWLALICPLWQPAGLLAAAMLCPLPLLLLLLGNSPTPHT